MDTIMRLLQMTDSTFPVGTFSFSNGLETAAHIHLVKDADTLEQYTRSVARQAAFSDGVAALIAYRATKSGDYDAILEIDRGIILFKMNDEARLMLQRMGKKLAELGVRLFNNPGGEQRAPRAAANLPNGEQRAPRAAANNLFARWLDDINTGITPGSYPVAQGIAFALAGISEENLFASHQYGVINMVLSAALRCVRVSHYDTQEILFRISEEVPKMYEQARVMTFRDMNSFVPEMDILASMHEKGNMRMFMN